MGPVVAEDMGMEFWSQLIGPHAGWLAVSVLLLTLMVRPLKHENERTWTQKVEGRFGIDTADLNEFLDRLRGHLPQRARQRGAAAMIVSPGDLLTLEQEVSKARAAPRASHRVSVYLCFSEYVLYANISSALLLGVARGIWGYPWIVLACWSVGGFLFVLLTYTMVVALLSKRFLDRLERVQ